MTSPLISIIVPIYNVEPYIERCLCSVISQTYRPLEVILVDDCSKDGSIDKAKAIVQSLNPKEITFIFESHDCNYGAATARNTGLRSATGKYVYFFDGDDEITADCIEELAKPLKNENYDFTIGDFQVTGGTVGCRPLGISGRCENVIRAYSEGDVYSMPVNKLTNLQFIRENKLYFKDGLAFEDELWSFQLACMAKKIFGIQKPFYIYHLRPGSTMDRVSPQAYIEGRFRIAPMMWEYIDTHGLSYDVYANNTIDAFIQSAHEIFVFSPKKEGYKYYKRIRQMNHRNWHIYCHLSFSSLSGFNKYFHYMLPIPLGFSLKTILRLPLQLIRH